ncbi:MAG: ferredoxin:protochlorophyllide reductase (ATP-dependent) subunit B, partial [Pseudomonadota bacterium]
REDHEFSDEAGASHLAAHAPRPSAAPAVSSEILIAPPSAHAAMADGGRAEDLIPINAVDLEVSAPEWDSDAQQELKKIPFFVRGKARQNTERYAAERGMSRITVETLYDAKAHFGR